MPITEKREVEDLLDRKKVAKGNRQVFEPLWAEIARQILPSASAFTRARSMGVQGKARNLYDSTALQARRMLVGRFDGLIKPRNVQWLRMRASDDRLNEREDVRVWTDDAASTEWREIYNPEAQFIEQSGKTDNALVSFGTGCLFTGPSNSVSSDLSFRHEPLARTYIDVNNRDEVDTIFRERTMTLRQIRQEFPDKARWPESFLEADRQNELGEKFDITHIGMPRKDRIPGRIDRLNKPHASIWIVDQDVHLLREGGYDEWPWAVPRWDPSEDEMYGRGPGEIALPDALTLQIMRKTLLRQGQKAVDPPLLSPFKGIRGDLNTFSRGVVYYDAELLTRTRGRIPVAPLQTGSQIVIGRELEEDTRQLIWSAFFRNVLNLPIEGPEMTATEILERKQEMVGVIGPTFGRIMSSYIRPVVNRAFSLLLLSGKFLPVPDVLAEQNITFVFESPIERIERQIEVAALRKTIEDLAAAAEISPEVWDHFDWDQIARDVPLANNVPQRWVQTERNVAQIRVERIRRAEAQAQFEQLAAFLELQQQNPNPTIGSPVP